MSVKAMIERAVLPIPSQRYKALITFDAKDAGASYPKIEPQRPPKGAPSRRCVVRRVERLRRALPDAECRKTGGRMVFSADEGCGIGEDTGAPVSEDYGARGNLFNGVVKGAQLAVAEAVEGSDHLVSPEEAVRIAMAWHWVSKRRRSDAHAVHPGPAL